MATDIQYIDTVWLRISKGLPQPETKLWRTAIQSTEAAALQRLADRCASDEYLAPLLQHEWDLTLGSAGTAGQVPIHNLSPTLLLSERARKRLRVTMTGLRFALKYRPNMHDLTNPPPIPDFDYAYYTLFQQNIVVRDFQGSVPALTDIQIIGQKVPIDLTDPVFDGELFDNLCDCGAELILESGSLSEVIRQAETPDAAPRAAVPVQA